MELMRRRYGIMGLNGGAGIPVITATATGNPLTFETDMVKPLKSLVVPFSPIQAGTGDPSPTNVRSISGRTGCTISHSGANTSNPTTLPISWQSTAGTVYGGTLTVNEDWSADLYVDVRTQTYKNRNDWEMSSGWGKDNTNVFFVSNQTAIDYPNYNTLSIVASDYFPTMTRNQLYSADTEGIGPSGTVQTAAVTIRINKSRASNLTQFKAWINEHNVTIAFKTKYPSSYHFGNIGQLMTFLGTNNIWSDTNEDMTITYLKHQS